MKLSILALFASVMVALCGSHALAAVDVFDSIPTGPIYNLPSLGFQATQTKEFGAYIQS